MVIQRSTHIVHIDGADRLQQTLNPVREVLHMRVARGHVAMGTTGAVRAGGRGTVGVAGLGGCIGVSRASDACPLLESGN